MTESTRPTPGKGLTRVNPVQAVKGWAGSLPRRSMPELFDAVGAAVDKAVTVPSSAVHSHVERIRERHPGATPAQVIVLLEREYLRTIAAAGGAVGVAAAVPGVGTGVSLALTASDVATFFAASSAFSLAVADVHGIEVDDFERRRALLLASVLGEDGAKALADAGLLSAGTWGKVLLTRMPTGTIKRVNGVLTRRLIRDRAAKQGALALGRIAPFGIGAVVGAVGARALGRGVIHESRKAFGPPPDHFPQVIEVIEAASDSAPPVALPTGRRA